MPFAPLHAIEALQQQKSWLKHHTAAQCMNMVRSIGVQQARQPLANLAGMHGDIIATRVC